jgi:hypothetical protein
MSAPLQKMIIKFGRETQRPYQVSCTSGDWVSMDVQYPQPFPAQANVVVIATANDLGVTDPLRNEPVVPVVEDQTPQGFKLWGRNPHECARSVAGFNWLAIAEVPSGEEPSHVAVRLGVVRPRFFWRRCGGDPRFWSVSFLPNRSLAGASGPPITLATATNLNVWATSGELSGIGGPTYAYTWETSYNAAAVPVIQMPTPDGFRLKGSNSDGQHGNCAFYHATFAELPGSSQGLWIEIGKVGAKSFEPRDNEGDWRMWDVEFQDPFLTPPTVLVTANDRMADGMPVPDHGAGGVFAKAVAAVGIATNVTTHGFTLMARNSDCAGGFAGFSWVALGCERFCA